MVYNNTLATDFSTDKKHVNLGQQIIDIQEKYAGQKTQNIRETTDEMGKEYMAQLISCAKTNLEKHNKDFYIVEVLRNDAILESVVKLHLQARWTRPKPEWGMALYRVDAASGNLIYLWGLPQKHEASLMMHNPEGWDQKTMQDIDDYLQGKLE